MVYIYDFQQFETIRSFGDNVYTRKINLDEARMDQRNLLENMVKFNTKLDQKKEDKEKIFLIV